MTDGKAESSGKAPLRAVDAAKKKQGNASAAHVFGEMRHSPEMIRELFRTGQYPYKNKIRKSVYETHKADLQVELL